MEKKPQSARAAVGSAPQRCRISSSTRASEALGAGLDARGVDGHPAQLHHALGLRPLQHLGEGIVEPPAMPTAKRAQGPVVHLFAGGQIAEGQIFEQPPRHLPRAGDAQRIGVERRATPPASAPVRTALLLPRCSSARSCPGPAAAPPRARKSRDGCCLTLLPRWVAADTPAPDNTA
jgi:hypothetical protein